MAEQGVVVSYNSDSDEMARRMNVEAGKATKYSGRYGGRPIPPHEAFKFVTLNPAKQLRIDRQTGTLEVGKDADLAIWSGIPTSPTSRCEATWVDGRRAFSLEQDTQHRKRIAGERSRLIQKVLAEGGRGAARGRGRSDSDDDDDGGGGGPVSHETRHDDEVATETSDDSFETSSAPATGRRLMLFDSIRRAADARRDIYMNMVLRGLDPRWMKSGDCGCGMTGGDQ